MMNHALPDPDFVLASEALNAALDQLQIAVDNAAPAPDGQAPCSIPLYGVGAGFVLHRSGRVMDLAAAERLREEHLAAAANPKTGGALARYARRCADELQTAIALSRLSVEIAQ
jgi:hypothetical protein